MYAVANGAFALALLVAGLILAVGGARLLFLGGTWWYACAGCLLVAVAVLVWRGNRRGGQLYGLLLVITILWSLWEVGLDAWALLPRLGMLVAGGLWLIAPFGWRAAGVAWRRTAGRRIWVAGAVATATLAIVLVPETSPPPLTAMATPLAPEAARDWRHMGGDGDATRYSPLDQIGMHNVAHLTLAWSARTGNLPAPGQSHNFEVTPLQVGNLLYLCTPTAQVLALDAATGEHRWRFDPAPGSPAAPRGACRGVSYHERNEPTQTCAQTLFVGTPAAQLWALDALTGEPCAQFGRGGAVDLRQGIGEIPAGGYAVTSPPVIVLGRVVVGAGVADDAVDAPSGVVRAFDAVTGELAWAWDIGRPGATGSPPQGKTYTRGTPNVWAPIAADHRSGLVFLPTGNPAVNYFAGKRRDFDEEFGSALVAVDVATGLTRWKFQTTHHDLWDFDLASQPTLLDMPGPDGPRAAIAVGSKSGDIFILDRMTGEPIVPVEEMPVAHDSPVDSGLSPTQPRSALAVNPGPARLSATSMWGLTPFDQMWCRIRFRESRYDGPYTPAETDRESIVFPGMSGGIEWGSLAFDPERRIMIANPMAMPFLLRVQRIDDNGPAAGFWEMPGTGHAAAVYPFFSPLGIPCLQPPWGALYAIDLDTQRILWKRPVGTAVDSGPFGIASRLPLLVGTPQLGGTLITRGGLIFSAATLDRYLRAYDVDTGRELWKARLPAGGQATPMTYEIGGHQYIVLAAGGHSELGTTAGDHVLAWRLPTP